MGWIREVAGCTLEYSGRIIRSEEFEDWVKSEGMSIISDLAQKRGLTFFGKRRAVAKEVWKELSLEAASDALKDAIQSRVTDYMKIVSIIVTIYDGLPHAPPFFAVPRYLVNWVARIVVKEKLGGADELNQLKGGVSLKTFFLDQLINEIDYRYQRLKFDVQHPIESGKGFIIKFDSKYSWLDQGDGTYYYVENKILDEDEELISEKLIEFSATLGTFSRNKKKEIIESIECLRKKKKQISLAEFLSGANSNDS